MVLAVVAVAIGVVTTGSWRLGVRWFGGALLFAALVRAVLPAKDAGMLAVRRRWWDCLLLAGTGAALIFLAGSIPDQPLDARVSRRVLPTFSTGSGQDAPTRQAPDQAELRLRRARRRARRWRRRSGAGEVVDLQALDDLPAAVAGDDGEREIRPSGTP